MIVYDYFISIQIRLIFHEKFSCVIQAAAFRD